MRKILFFTFALFVAAPCIAKVCQKDTQLFFYVPNYENGQTISSPFTVPSNGYIIGTPLECERCSKSLNITINSVLFICFSIGVLNVDYHVMGQTIFPVKKNDAITFTGENSLVRFFPAIAAPAE
jgi:hypothetical protein